MINRAKTKPRRECVYCGSQQKLTRDHIPPKNLFAKPLPSNLVTVPCCRRCNESASKDDEYFRFIITRDDAGGHPEARKILPAVLKSLQRPQAMGLTNLMGENLFDIDVNTPTRNICRTPSWIQCRRTAFRQCGVEDSQGSFLS